ncbi:hypothetical protein Htur_2991 [Haloterrigena turkmenica DSM 5511]|uniref:Uncharacterized protein n=1 Tax=Haloterrigena turkmenica (strain ATCC 51198 / DSM 5511 / JCM 9101 / NCIMB 13204 / VKM B-1734 / 4k) TaxID=543526 RepID=D2RYB3_HALTV|nr:hypothetical protein [Haloterrigena turkmenica]ADB61859.1 hypothetical protein Htur_2991 [Haloterrigena turkmenica DSM 5511]
MGGKKTEACGRCSMSTVVDVASSNDGEGESEDEPNRDPFGESAIEVDDETLRRVSPGAWASRVTDRINDVGRRLIYGR